MAAKKFSTFAKSEQAAESIWQTPPWLVDRIHALFGGIELDPCTTDENHTRAERFYTPANDGILQPWNAERIYVNPPYGRTIGHWIEKCAVAAASGSQIVALVPARTGSRWFRRAWETADEILFINGRLKFWKARASAMFPCVLFAWNCSLSELADVGMIVLITESGGKAA